uniref:MARVEL domain-containing protein n=1 Tax=Rhabditophanes sp. KR3021 TaxID=114890 RepID=A0AC35TYY2_9BILA
MSTAVRVTCGLRIFNVALSLAIAALIFVGPGFCHEVVQKTMTCNNHLYVSNWVGIQIWLQMVPIAVAVFGAVFMCLCSLPNISNHEMSNVVGQVIVSVVFIILYLLCAGTEYYYSRHFLNQHHPYSVAGANFYNYDAYVIGWIVAAGLYILMAGIQLLDTIFTYSSSR